MEKIVPVSSICPEGYELDKEKSTIENLIFKSKKESYEDVYKKLFYDREGFFFDVRGQIKSSIFCDPYYKDLINCTSEKQAKKLLAINQLMNIAKYLNGDWKPDWDNEKEFKYYILLNLSNNKINIYMTCVSLKSIVYFQTEELAKKAIDILGEETIKLALSTDW